MSTRVEINPDSFFDIFRIMPDFFDPPPEQQSVVLVGAARIRQAESLIESCEHCNLSAEIPFDWILDRVTGRDPSVTDYILESPAQCPNCRREINEKTLIHPVS